MAQVYQFAFVDVAIDTLWRIVFHEAERQGTILVMREPDLLVVTSQDVSTIYGLRQYPAMEEKTGLYLVVTHDEAAAVDLVHAENLFATLEALPVDVTAEVYEEAKTHLQTLQTLAHQTAQTRAKAAALQSKPSIDPHKSDPEQPQDVAYGKGAAVVTSTSIWLMFIFLGGIFSAALLLALNWWGMGRPRKAASTFVSIILVWSILTLLIYWLILPSNLSGNSVISSVALLQIAAAIGVVLWQMKQQRPAYQQAVEQYGPPSAWKRRGVLMLAGAVVTGVLIGMAWPRVFNDITKTSSYLFGALASKNTYRDARITLNYPLTWRPVSWLEDACQNEDFECLFGVGEIISSDGLILRQRLDAFNFLVTFNAVRYTTKNDIEATFTNVRDLTELSYEIDGRQALRYEFLFTTSIGSGRQAVKEDVVGNILFIEDGNDLLRLEILGSPGIKNTADAVIDSVRFINPLPND